MAFDLLIRIIIVLTTLFLILYENVDYKIPFLVLNLFYLSSIFLILSFGRGKFIQFFTLVIDIIFISIFVYLTSYPEVSLFVLPFAIRFLENIKSLIIFSVFSFFPILFGVYISGFAEFTFIPFYFAFLLSLFGFHIKLKNEREVINSIKNSMEEIYKQNLKLQGDTEKLKRYKYINDISVLLLDRKININSYLVGISEFLTNKGIVFFDFKLKRCLSVGEIECVKEIPQYLTSGFNILKDTKVNELTNTDVIVSLSIECENHIHGFILIGYEDINEDEIELLKTIYATIRAYSCS